MALIYDGAKVTDTDSPQSLEIPLPLGWLSMFDERQRKEIDFSRVYVKEFGHGTDGHNSKRIIAQFAELMDVLEDNHVDVQTLWYEALKAPTPDK